jgi:SPRY domain-containing SOCS box protein 1/4
MNGADTLMVPNTILCLLDMDEGTLSFAADGYYLGVAFRHLNGMQLYPLIGTDCENCEITIRYLGCSNR